MHDWAIRANCCSTLDHPFNQSGNVSEKLAGLNSDLPQNANAERIKPGN